MPNYQDIISFIEALDSRRYPYNHHGPRVSILSMDLAQHAGLSPREIELIGFGGSLHDVGKFFVDEEILNAPRKVNPIEYAKIKLHPREGYRLLEGLGYDPIILDIVLHHHEHWDGGGYPDRLGGVQISIHARIICIVDVFDAMTNHRPYRDPLAEDFARRQMMELSGKFFDPRLVSLFFEKVVQHG